MYIIKYEKEHPFSFPEQHTRLTAALSTSDLPKSYLRLLKEKNGGYVKNMIVPTEEPTSDGLDYANLHYIFGWHEEAAYSILHQQKATLPDYFLVFSANGSQLFAFDFSLLDATGEPAIRYLDIETDNWQTVAPDFETFLATLQPGTMDVIPQTRLEAEHGLLLAKEASHLQHLFESIEDWPDKEWYFDWLVFFTNHPDSSLRFAALDALEMQFLYFRLLLPPNAKRVLDVFCEDEDNQIRSKARQIKIEHLS